MNRILQFLVAAVVVGGGYVAASAIYTVTEIEQVIWSDPAVQDCAVIGIPDDKWGEQVTAVVEPKPGMTVDTDALIQLCKAKLGSVKAPKQLLVWPELPRSPVGKVLKRTIRESFWKGRDRAV